MGEKMHFETDDIRNFILVVWLSNLEKPQDEETDKTFTGYLEIESTLGSKITGSINANVNNS